MAELDIKRVIVTPMQRLSVVWQASNPAPDSYTVTCENTGVRAHVDTVTVPGDQTQARTSQLYRPGTYSVTVTANRSGFSETGAQEMVDIVVESGMGGLLRQAVFDVLFDAGLTLDGRPVTLFHDGDFQPAAFDRTTSNALPIIEIGEAEQVYSVRVSTMTDRDDWVIPIRLFVPHGEKKGDSGNHWERLDFLREQVRREIDGTPNLNVSLWGVMDRAWKWGRPRRLTDKKRLAGLEVPLTVTVQQLRERVTMG